MLLTMIKGRRGGKAIKLYWYIEHKLDLTRPDEITEKNTNKGYNRTLNILQWVRITVSRLVYSYMGIL